MKLYYKLKFFLNGRHYITHANGDKGEVHPHNWEIEIKMCYREERDEYEYFATLEELIKGYFAIFEGETLNNVPPFENINPTLENITIVSYKHIKNVLASKGYVLKEISIKESPSRSVVIDFTDDLEDMKKEVADRVSKDIIKFPSGRPPALQGPMNQPRDLAKSNQTGPNVQSPPELNRDGIVSLAKQKIQSLNQSKGFF